MAIMREYCSVPPTGKVAGSGIGVGVVVPEIVGDGVTEAVGVDPTMYVAD